MIQISILRERNIYQGVLISSLVTVGSYIVVSILSILASFSFVGFYLYADIEFLFGTIFGVVITIKNRQEHQKIVKIGVISGIVGGILSSFFIGLYEMILNAIFYVPEIMIFIFFFGFSLISGIVIGLIGGALIGTYYTYKETKKGFEDDKLEDDFFDDLIKK